MLTFEVTNRCALRVFACRWCLTALSVTVVLMLNESARLKQALPMTLRLR